MINIDDDPKEIVKELSETEKNILFILGKMRISVNKNVNEHSLKKKLSNEDLKNYKKAFSNLCNSGIIVMYRPGNFGVSKQGRRITDEIVELYRQEKYRAIIVIFLSSCRKYFIRQDLLDEESYSLLWDKAHDYIYEFINGSKRPSVRPHPAKKTRSSSSVIGYRKRSFSSHIATSGVWGRIAAYGGTNGRIIRISRNFIK